MKTTCVTHSGAATGEFTVISLSIRQRFGARLLQRTLFFQLLNWNKNNSSREVRENKRLKRPLSLTSEQWTHKKIDFGMEQKITTLHPTCSRSLLCCSLPVWRSTFLKKPPVTYFRPALDPPLGRSCQNTLMHVRCHEHFIPAKFHKHPSIWESRMTSSSRSENISRGRHALT